MLNECLIDRACSSPLHLGGSLLERKRSQLGFLPPPTSEIVDGAVSISSPVQRPERSCHSPMEFADAIETPPYDSLPLEIDPTEECTDKFSPSVLSLGPGSLLSRFEDNMRAIKTSSSVGFCDQVYVHFYSTDSPATSVSFVDPQVGRVKRFDGRSDCERGVLFDDCLEVYLKRMSSRCFEEEEEDMDRDILFCGESEGYDRQQRRRPRFYAADETTLTWNNSSICEEDSGSNFLWMMENTPCDCDLLIVG